MQDAKWIWLNPEHFPQYQKGQATTFAEKGDFVADYSSGYPGLYMRLTHGDETILTDESWLAYPAMEFPSIRTYDATRLGEAQKTASQEILKITFPAFFTLKASMKLT